MQRTPSLLALLLATLIPAHAQWQLQTSNTTADLRGIHSIGKGIAWASGTNGTILRTEDGGYVWQSCSIPPGAEHLDFRGIQAFNANIAIVMSSGKGDQSRLYKTSDGCHSWTLLFSNPDPDGFWDAIVLNRFAKDGELLGDPVNGKFAFWETEDKGNSWQRPKAGGLEALTEEGAFAASNSSLFLNEEFATGFVTGGPSGARILTNTGRSETEPFKSHALPLAGGSSGAGAFSIEARDACCWIAVGGDYTKPGATAGTAAYTHDGGKTWHAALIPPHGYRSSVSWDKKDEIWITAGPNGTDFSADDGRNWYPLHPNPKKHDSSNAPDTDKNWNALSLPFAVGPKGRIGKLNPADIPH
jgi:photosystem II stability/assembly factor-like uncharacterized protein